MVSNRLLYLRHRIICIFSVYTVYIYWYIYNLYIVKLFLLCHVYSEVGSCFFLSHESFIGASSGGYADTSRLVSAWCAGAGSRSSCHAGGQRGTWRVHDCSKYVLFCLGNLVVVCSVSAFANAHIHTNTHTHKHRANQMIRAHNAHSLHMCISWVNHKARNSFNLTQVRLLGENGIETASRHRVASDRWRRGGCNRSSWRWQMEGQSDDGVPWCTVLMTCYRGRQPRLREMVLFTVM